MNLRFWRWFGSQKESSLSGRDQKAMNILRVIIADRVRDLKIVSEKYNYLVKHPDQAEFVVGQLREEISLANPLSVQEAILDHKKEFEGTILEPLLKTRK